MGEESFGGRGAGVVVYYDAEMRGEGVGNGGAEAGRGGGYEGDFLRYCDERWCGDGGHDD